MKMPSRTRQLNASHHRAQCLSCPHLTLLLGVLVGSLAAGGCAKRHNDFAAFISEPRPLVTSSDYILEPPDTIRITTKRVREVNGHTETIRPDGKITLPLLGSIFVAGRTAESVSAELSAMAREYYEDAEVSLRVVAFRSKNIFVFGEVASPGAHPYNGANTVLGTLANAHPTRLADPKTIHVLRPSPDGEMRRKMTIDLNKMVKEGDTTLDAVLEEGDIIYVPPNPLAAVGLALQQVLLPITPAAAVVRNPSDISSDVTDPNYGREWDNR